MQFIEKKTEQGYFYKTTDLGELTIESKDKIDVDTLDSVLMNMFRRRKPIKNLLVDTKSGKIKVSYTPPNVWEDIKEKPKKIKLKTKIKQWIIKQIQKL